jgi:predicted transcriptional regulator YdeE
MSRYAQPAVWKRCAGSRLTLSLVVCVIVLAFHAEAEKEAEMHPRVVQHPAFTVIGIAARTNNAKEMAGDGVIGKQWARFMQEGLLEKIPNRADSNIVALFTDYASDKDGDYTLVIGARVTSTEKVPTGMVAKPVPAGRYAVFTSEKGPVAKVVVDTWRRIWTTPKGEPGGDRAYKTDFEIYDQRARDPEATVVDVYVGIR